MPVKLNSSGGGSLTLDLGSTAATYTQTLPLFNGSLVAADSNGNVSVSGNLAVTGNVSITGNLVPATSYKRNRIINGNMRIWQRGTSQSSPGNPATYGSVDRWFFQSSTTNAAISQSTSVPTGFPYSVKVQRVAAGTGTQRIYMGQVIESFNCSDLSSQTVTLSFWAKAGANFSAASNNITALIYTGTVADQGTSTFSNSGFVWTGGSVAVSSAISITTTWTRYTVTATLGAGVLEVGVYFNFTPTGTAGADDAMYITGVQLEPGSLATPYEFVTYSEQLAQCQRYLPVLQGNGSGNSYIAPAMASSTTAFQFHYTFKVTPRVPPTSIASTSFSGFAFNDTTNVTTATNLSLLASNYDSCLVGGTVASGLTQFRSGALQLGSSSYILFTGCEL